MDSEEIGYVLQNGVTVINKPGYKKKKIPLSNPWAKQQGCNSELFCVSITAEVIVQPIHMHMCIRWCTLTHMSKNLIARKFQYKCTFLGC